MSDAEEAPAKPPPVPTRCTNPECKSYEIRMREVKQGSGITHALLELRAWCRTCSKVLVDWTGRLSLYDPDEADDEEPEES